MDTIDPALRRSGRLDAEIEVSTPTEEERLKILMVNFILSNKIMAESSFLNLISKNW